MTNATLEQPEPDNVPEAETVLQPSSHTMREYLDLLLSEAVSREIDVSDLQSDAEYIDSSLTLTDQSNSDLIDETLDAIQDAGYAVIEENDSLLIYGLNVDVPE